MPLGNRVQTWFGLKNFAITMPFNLQYKDIKKIRILPRNRAFYVEFIYKVKTTTASVNPESVNKAARLVINHCIENKIGRVVFGWNPGQKNGANMRVKTNQKFVQIPTARLKTRISQLCQQYGIEAIAFLGEQVRRDRAEHKRCAFTLCLGELINSCTVTKLWECHSHACN